MNQSFRYLPAVFVLTVFVLLTGCGKGEDTGGTLPLVSYSPGKTQILLPQSDGDTKVSADPLTIDCSHTDQGYFSAFLSRENTKISIQVIGPDDITYKYFLTDAKEWITFPLTAGDGLYTILAFENIGNNQYASLFHYNADVVLQNEFLPYLYPNQYVNFTPESDLVSLASSLTMQSETDLDALTAIFQYVTEHVSYDYEKAETVSNDYLPNPDEILSSGTGICFDYASLTASMLRSLGIPTRLDIGYSGEIKHAWITVYIESIGWMSRAVEFNGDEWKLLDPTFASTTSDISFLSDYIGDGENYTLLYVR